MKDYIAIGVLLGVFLLSYSLLLIADMVDKRRGRKP